MRRGDRAIVVSSGGRRVRELEKIGAMHIEKPVHTKNPVKMIAHAFWLASLIRAENVNVVHARSRAPAWSAFLACRMTGCAYVTTFHAAYNFSSSIKKRYNRVMANADRVIAISDFIAAHIRENYETSESRLRVINRGLDPALFDPEKSDEEKKNDLRHKWGIEKTDRVMILPARLSPIKGQKIAVAAMAELKKQGEPLPLLLIIGDDQGRRAYTQELQDMIAGEGLNERVRLTGACADMAAAYGLADLVLAPSQVPEGFGRTPVEAMAMGVPVISSALGAAKDTIIEGKTGWLIPPKEIKAWAKQIKAALALSSESRAQMAALSRARVREHFTLNRMVEKTLAVYDEIAG
jgi:glycosyltransferase involved in cell wall biosynthesis